MVAARESVEGNTMEIEEKGIRTGNGYEMMLANRF